MKNFFLLIPLISLFLFSCKKEEENLLEGKWELTDLKAPDSGIVTTEFPYDSLREKYYEFYSDNQYTFEGIVTENGKNELFVRKGSYELDKENDQLYLTLKERQIDGVKVRTYQVSTLTDTVMVWENELKTRYFLKRAQVNWTR